MLNCDVKAKYRLISGQFFGHEVFSAERSLKQPKAARVCMCSTNQSNSSISNGLLFLFSSRLFSSRSYENRSTVMLFNVWIKAPYASNASSYMRKQLRYLLSRYLLFTVKPGQSIRGRTKFEQDCFNIGFIISFNFSFFS